jgi:deoxyribodipyrimidine photo-lyase
VQPLRPNLVPEAGVPSALLITEDDCRMEDFPLHTLDLRAAATLSASHERSPGSVAAMVAAFEDAALADAAARSAQPCQILRAGVPADLAAWASRAGARQIVTAHIPQGPMRDWLQAAEPALSANGIVLREWRREWDSAIWPHASAGFFKVKSRIPQILDQIGLT